MSYGDLRAATVAREFLLSERLGAGLTDGHVAVFDTLRVAAGATVGG